MGARHTQRVSSSYGTSIEEFPWTLAPLTLCPLLDFVGDRASFQRFDCETNETYQRCQLSRVEWQGDH
jgi:hypothetical protein